jgi:hypothetical protein
VFGQNDTPKLPIDSLTGKITFTEVVSVDNSTNKQELYSRAREWFVKSFKSSKSVIEFEDKETGKIIGRGTFSAITEESMNDNEFIKNKGLVSKELRERKSKGEVGSISFLISIYVKDGRYKYEITDLIHKGITTTVAGYTVTQPDGGDLSNIDPTCGYSQLMPTIRWKNIKANSFLTIESLIKDLKSTMAVKDKTNDF